MQDGVGGPGAGITLGRSGLIGLVNCGVELVGLPVAVCRLLGLAEGGLLHIGDELDLSNPL